MKKALLALGVLAAATALPAAAQQTQHFYAGLSLGQSKFSDECSQLPGFSCDDKDTAFRIFGGYQFHPNIGVELGYADLGKAKFSASGTGGSVSGEEKFTAWDLVAVGSYPVGTSFSVYGKLGLYYGKAEASANAVIGPFGASASDSETGTDFTYGLGAGFDFNKNFGARIEWQRYNGFSDASNLDVFSLGVLYRFR